MTKNLVCLATLFLCLFALTLNAQVKVETEEEKTLYALGLLLGRNIKPFTLSADELAIVKAGLNDSVMNAKPQVDLDVYGPKIDELAQKRAAAGAAETKKK